MVPLLTPESDDDSDSDPDTSDCEQQNLIQCHSSTHTELDVDTQFIEECNR